MTTAKKKSRHPAPTGRKLTPRQAAFVAAYASGTMTATQACVAAGYSAVSARCMAGDLKNHPLVKAELEKIAERVRDNTAYTATEAMREADEVAAFARSKGQAQAYLGAVALKARLCGLLVERQQVQVVAELDISAALAEAKARVLSREHNAENATIEAQRDLAQARPMTALLTHGDAEAAEFRELTS